MNSNQIEELRLKAVSMATAAFDYIRLGSVQKASRLATRAAHWAFLYIKETQ